jgi:hypothetical protein
LNLDPFVGHLDLSDSWQTDVEWKRDQSEEEDGVAWTALIRRGWWGMVCKVEGLCEKVEGLCGIVEGLCGIVEGLCSVPGGASGLAAVE